MTTTRGPDPLGFTEELRCTISPEADNALRLLVELSGVSRAHFVRQALNDMLAAMGLVFPGVADTLHPTLTGGPNGPRTQKKKDAL